MFVHTNLKLFGRIILAYFNIFVYNINQNTFFLYICLNNISDHETKLRNRTVVRNETAD